MTAAGSSRARSGLSCRTSSISLSGIFSFPRSIGYGRFLFHNFLVLVVIFAIGLVLWKKRGSPLFLALGVGVLSHQVLDQMWTEVPNWFWPLFGPLRLSSESSGYYFQLIQQDFSNPAEWLLADVFAIALILYIYRDDITAAASSHTRKTAAILKCAALALWIYSGIMISEGLVRHLPPVPGTGTPPENIFIGVVAALTALVAIRWEQALDRAEPPAQPGAGCPGCHRWEDRNHRAGCNLADGYDTKEDSKG